MKKNDSPEPAKGLEPSTVAVITAAVATFLAGRPFRIQRIELAGPSSSLWAQLGRQSIHASHVIERNHR